MKIISFMKEQQDLFKYAISVFRDKSDRNKALRNKAIDYLIAIISLFISTTCFLFTLIVMIIKSK